MWPHLVAQGGHAAAPGSAAHGARRRKEAMRLHLGLQLTGLVLALAGTLAMFTHRHARLKAHFSTPHAWLGVSAVILAELGGLLGVLLYFNTLRISRALIGRLHFLHRMLSIILVELGGLLGVLLYFNILRISRALIGRLHFLHRMVGGWVGRLVIIRGFISIILALKIDASIEAVDTHAAKQQSLKISLSSTSYTPSSPALPSHFPSFFRWDGW
ncbi:unnamed protein product [Closterium sp. NIES-64]|nr:unnamed protein product [Closterium sp. NIES-64]